MTQDNTFTPARRGALAAHLFEVNTEGAVFTIDDTNELFGFLAIPCPLCAILGSRQPHHATMPLWAPDGVADVIVCPEHGLTHLDELIEWLGLTPAELDHRAFNRAELAALVDQLRREYGGRRHRGVAQAISFTCPHHNGPQRAALHVGLGVVWCHCCGAIAHNQHAAGERPDNRLGAFAHATTLTQHIGVVDED